MCRAAWPRDPTILKAGPRPCKTDKIVMPALADRRVTSLGQILARAEKLPSRTPDSPPEGACSGARLPVAVVAPMREADDAG